MSAATTLVAVAVTAIFQSMVLRYLTSLVAGRPLSGILLASFLLFFVLNTSAELSPVAAQSDPSATILQLINEFRASRGLPPFQYNASLATAAQSHANWMAANSVYSHTGANWSTPQSRAQAAGYNGSVSENIVGGTNQSPRQGLIWWQNSQIHLNTLVSNQYVEAGTGFAVSGEQNMYVLVVGRPSNSPPAANNRPANTQPKPLIITPIKLAEPREDGSIVHVLQTGQALWTVAAYYDVDLNYLYLINGFTEKDVLHPGTEVMVRLANGQEPPPTPTPPLTYVVGEGESAWSIAIKHDISLDFLYLLNNMDDRSMLQPGDEVVVRLAEGQAPPPTPTPRMTHLVQSGESLWSIAAVHGLTIDELLSFNGMTVDSVIRAGDELVIHPPTPTPLPVTPNPTDPAATTPSVAQMVTVPPVGSPDPVQVADVGLSTTPASNAGAQAEDGEGSMTRLVAISAVVVLVLLAGLLISAARPKQI